ncbi:MAG TPA: hypothetical protein VGF67_27210 [Ktedonobacteraceae bacterium]|jgi:hypothetical protein
MMAVTVQVPELVQQKLEAFASMQAEFETCFHFQQEVHGQKRFSSFPVGRIVYYLHALWLCERKDRLFSVYKNIRRYEGERCLKLLRDWQIGQNAPVVAFLLQKLDMLSFADITAQIEEVRRKQGNETLARRLEHGRLVLLNRGMNLMHALEAIFSLSEKVLLDEVRPACEQYGHTPAHIAEQLADLQSPLYTYRPHQLLAQRNMVVMNKLEVDVLARHADQPGERSRHVQPPVQPLASIADHVIAGYLPLLAPIHNNLRKVRFIDRVDPDARQTI